MRVTCVNVTYKLYLKIQLQLIFYYAPAFRRTEEWAYSITINPVRQYVTYVPKTVSRSETYESFKGFSSKLVFSYVILQYRPQSMLVT